MPSLKILTLPKNPYGVTTPLRYPGGKSAISGFLGSIISQYNQNNNVRIDTYVEPYAGGAGAAISLLLKGVVNNIVINDYDVAVYSFWESLVKRPHKFLNKLMNTDIDIFEWHKQRDIYKYHESDSAEDRLNLGFAFFFLNRTNRSGIVKAGVIGGMDQSGNYKLNARFKPEKLAEKISKITEFRKNITVTKNDGARIFNDYESDKSAFIYLDPPYVAQGKNLYLNFFNEDDHRKIANVVSPSNKANWVMTYDNEPLITDLYRKNNKYLYNLHYSAQTNRTAQELLICSDSMNEAVLGSTTQQNL
ncbi:MAG: DNA adenine methylase [Candidatus Ancillula sp.]|jgi:DNA adenine methylase|nr:DNA adenine methylase [Candidatus Ancillula sp.]